MKTILNWKEYEKAAREAIAEGCVLIENKNHVLPLKKNSTVSVFGRIQSSYYKSGTGSGGKVNVSKVYNIVEGLEESGHVQVNQELKEVYAQWEKEHPYDEGLGWGKERWSQDEMPLSDEVVSRAASVSDYAVCIIGRTAGEDKDNSADKGSWFLTDEEMDMLVKVRSAFSKMIILLNTGNIIDMSFMDSVKPDSVMYVWQGGMLGGLGTADLLTGKVCPSGRLTDTIAYKIEDYPSHPYFGTPEGNFYSEDIFVGYRYFETFARDKVRYPFGYGLSYSNFKTSITKANIDSSTFSIQIESEIQNKGNCRGKETVMFFVEAPNGKLGKASRVLVDFSKSPELAPEKIWKNKFIIPSERYTSYDDSGVTGFKNSFVLEAGDYTVYAGSDVRSAKPVLSFTISETRLIKKCEEALAPVQAFERMHADENGNLVMEKVPLSTVDMWQKRKENLPEEIPQTGDKGYTLKSVLKGKVSVEDFVAQMSDEDLSCIIRGEGMGSSLVTPGTASALGGVSDRLRNVFGIPAVCCDDGPSGMRLDCGIKAFSLPNGTSLACTFNREAVAKLYSFTGLEMRANNVDCLLGPGINIHRHPLNGRNFEYFSEDPYLTGEIGSYMVQGLQSSGVTCTIKHFAANNQETNRRAYDSILSQRALREIYLKPFEICVKDGANSIMTTYGLVNGQYTAGNYDLNTSILRKDWGYEGIVMTDWWAAIDRKGDSVTNQDFGKMIRAQNDLYMCCPNGSRNEHGDNTLEALQSEELTRGELQRSAINISLFAATSWAMKRMINSRDKVIVKNRPVCADDINPEDVTFTKLEKHNTIDLTYQKSKKDTNYVLAFDVKNLGTYELKLYGSSELNEVAQMPCTLFFMGIPIASFVFNGSNGKEVCISRTICFPSRFNVDRLYVAANGLKLTKLEIDYLSDEVYHF